MVARLIVYDTKVDVGQEFSSNVSHLFVSRVVVDRIPVELRLRLSQFHVVYSDAVVGECFTVHVADRFANLEELFVLVHCLLELAQVVIEHTC